MDEDEITSGIISSAANKIVPSGNVITSGDQHEALTIYYYLSSDFCMHAQLTPRTEEWEKSCPAIDELLGQSHRYLSELVSY